MTKRFGFTLAEVLITLGIIGVVAAMTMPTLMNSTQGAQYKAAYKKALSALSQAVTLNVALDEWNFADLDPATAGYTMKDMLSNRMNVVRTEDGTFKGKDGTTNYSVKAATKGGAATAPTAPGEGNTTLFFNDGIMFTFQDSAEACTKGAGGDSTIDETCYGFIDVNGVQAPNKEVGCDSGDSDDDCVIKSPTDVYPVVFYDQTILPSSPAARAVLYSK